MKLKIGTKILNLLKIWVLDLYCYQKKLLKEKKILNGLKKIRISSSLKGEDILSLTYYMIEERNLVCKQGEIQTQF